MDGLMNGLLAPLLVSLVIAFGARFVDSSADSAFLKQNIEATQDLSRTMKSLEIQLGVFGERYVTRDEMERKMKDMNHGS